MTIPTVVASVLVATGLVGIMAPVLPGLVLVVGGIAVWAVARADRVGWAVLAVAVAVAVLGSVAKYLLPGRALGAEGVPRLSLVAGAVAGVVGFFVVPIVGLLLGFVAGVYLAELIRLGGHARAWPSTRATVRAVGWSILIELAAGLLAAATWLTGVFAA